MEFRTDSAMRVSKEVAQQSRERIVDVSSRLFRERGVDGVGIVDLMNAAGFTHGGFYKHFDSKQALAAEACARAFDDPLNRRRSRLLEGGDDAVSPIRRFAEGYLSQRHRDNPGTGCPLPALGADAARHEAELRSAYTAGLKSLVDFLARSLPGRQKKARREKALATLACLVGALTLARAVDDEALSSDILQAAIRSIE
jgi:TetR/AcrR family transcriptional repressor of nem operon